MRGELLFRRRRDRSEQPVGLIIGTGCEIEGVGAGIPASAQNQLPQSVDDERLALGAVQLVDKLPLRAEHIDFAVAEIA